MEGKGEWRRLEKKRFSGATATDLCHLFTKPTEG
jgi:hypothetical protein